MRFSVQSVSIGKLYFAIWSGSIHSPYNLADRFKIHLIVRFDTWNIRIHQADPISGGRAVKPAVQKAHNTWVISGMCDWRKLPRRVTSRPEIEIADQRLAFSYQNPSIEPPYKIVRKQLKMSIAQFPQTTDHLLCAFWTVGITARPPDIGSNSCILIFQVSNRTIRCILERSGGCWEDFFMNLPMQIISWVTRAILGCTAIFP